MIEDFFVSGQAAPEQMDSLWAEGWRHFGALFFRYSTVEHAGTLCHVIPLRVDLSRFSLSRSQKRVLSKNRDVEVVIRDSTIDSEKEALFERHRRRFKDNAPDSLFDFVSESPASVPCPSQEICVYRAGALLAFSFLDIGATATSAVYAAFEPREHKRSLGILTILHAIDQSCRRGFRYYYPGYAYREPSMYDYKKKLAGLEFLEWNEGWKPFTRE